MKTLKSACKPRDTVFDAARRDTVLDLSDLVGDRIKPEEFFPENYITEGMKTLLTEGFRRLEGKSDQLATKLSQELPDETIGVYAGAARSGLMKQGTFSATSREELKTMVRKDQLRLLLGTDAASEGLNLQRLGTLINFDLPWNPSRLEQRKGRIQRIGQIRDTVDICNLRYAGSVEDRVRQLLSSRLQNISTLFGQLPDILEDVWVDVALGQLERAKRTIDTVPRQHPFKLRYHRVESVNWESCATVLNSQDRRAFLTRGWN